VLTYESWHETLG